MRQLIALKDIKPNPHKNFDKFPIDPIRVASIVESIKATSFWDNFLVRKVGDAYELTDGHIRLAALNQLYPPEHEVECTVKDISDADMLKIYFLANNQQYVRTEVSRLLEALEGAIKHGNDVTLVSDIFGEKAVTIGLAALDAVKRHRCPHEYIDGAETFSELDARTKRANDTSKSNLPLWEPQNWGRCESRDTTGYPFSKGQ